MYDPTWDDTIYNDIVSGLLQPIVLILPHFGLRKTLETDLMPPERPTIRALRVFLGIILNPTVGSLSILSSP